MAIFLILLFLALAVFLRAVIQWYKTGDFGIRMASYNTPMIEIIPGTLFVLSFCVAFLLTVLSVYDLVTALIELPIIVKWLSFLLSLSGILITVISQYQMGDSWRIGVDQNETTALKTNGLYARCRNPIYFGLLLFLIGLCGTFPNIILLVSALVCWICIEVIVRKIEEPYLFKVHGDDFTYYFDQTNRYFPF